MTFDALKKGAISYTYHKVFFEQERDARPSGHSLTDVASGALHTLQKNKNEGRQIKLRSRRETGEGVTLTTKRCMMKIEQWQARDHMNVPLK